MNVSRTCLILSFQEPMDVDTTNSVASLRVFEADMSVIKPSPSGHLTLPGGSPLKAGMSTPDPQTKPRRSPRSGNMPPPAVVGRKPWQSGRGPSVLTSQAGGVRPGKKTMKHSASTSVLPKLPSAGTQPPSFR